MSKLAMISALIAICVMLALAIDAFVSSRVGEVTWPLIDPIEVLKHAH